MARFIAALWCCFVLHGAAAATATIASASNFRMAMDELTVLFTQRYPYQLRHSYASSGVLFNQISHGAPFDVFLSADSHYPITLADNGMAVAESRFTYAEGKLVLVSSKPLTGGTVVDRGTITAALNAVFGNGGKVAIANPDIAPYGIAAKQALSYLELWRNNQSKLVRATNVGQSFQFVATGNAAIGFAALSQLQRPQHKAIAALHYWPIPGHWYQPIRQQAILLQSAGNNPAAIAFMDFLTTDDAKAVIQRHGYATP